MKPLLLLGLLLPYTGSAQVVNGSFEADGNPDLTGWEWTYGQAISSSDVPGGTGSYSIALSGPVAEVFQRHTELLYGDSVVISGWSRVDGGWFEPPGFGLGHLFQDGLVVNPPLYLTSFSSTWLYSSGTCAIPPISSTDTLVLWMYNGGAETAYFDGLSMEHVLPTSISDQGMGRLPHRPDPVTDRLWVATGTQPTMTTLIGASGQKYQGLPQMFANGTLEVDVSRFPPGLYLLRIVLGERSGVVRFVKL